MLSQNLTATGSLARFIEILACNLTSSQIMDAAMEATAANPTSDESQLLMESVGQIVLSPAYDDRMSRSLTQSEEAAVEQWLNELAKNPF